MAEREEEQSVAEEIAVKTQNETSTVQYETEPTIKKSVAENDFDRIDSEIHAHTFDKEKLTESISGQTIEWNSEELNEAASDEEMNESRIPRMDEVTVTEALGTEGHYGEMSDSEAEEEIEPMEYAPEVEKGIQPLDDQVSIVEKAIQSTHEQELLVEDEIPSMNEDSTVDEAIEPMEYAPEVEKGIQPLDDQVSIVEKAIQSTQEQDLQVDDEIRSMKEDSTVDEEIEPTDNLNPISAQEVEPKDELETLADENRELLENLDSTTGTPAVSMENQESKKEKIVPFNVLMLKNDKLKYEEREKREISQPAPHTHKNDTQQAPVSKQKLNLTRANRMMNLKNWKTNLIMHSHQKAILFSLKSI